MTATPDQPGRRAADAPRQAQDEPADADAAGQRDALMDAERKAAEGQPDSFMDRAVTDKVVEIPPVDSTDTPMEGLDPKPK